MAKLAFAFQETSAPDVTLEWCLIDIRLPVLVYHFGQIDLFGLLRVFIEPFDPVNSDISFLLFSQLMLDLSFIVYKLSLDERLILNVPF